MAPLPPDRPPTDAEIWQAALEDLRALVARERSAYWWLWERWRLRQLAQHVAAGRWRDAERAAWQILVLLDGDLTQPPRARRTLILRLVFWALVAAGVLYIIQEPLCYRRHSVPLASRPGRRDDPGGVA